MRWTVLALVGTVLLATGCPRTWVSIDTLTRREPFSYRTVENSYATDVDPSTICDHDTHYDVPKWGERAEDGRCRPIAAVVDPDGVAWPGGFDLEALSRPEAAPCVGVFDRRPLKRLPYEGLFLIASDSADRSPDLLVVWDEEGLVRVGATFGARETILSSFGGRGIGRVERRQLEFCGMTEAEVRARNFPLSLAAAEEAVGALGPAPTPARLDAASRLVSKARADAPAAIPAPLEALQATLLEHERALYGAPLAQLLAPHYAKRAPANEIGDRIARWKSRDEAAPPDDRDGARSVEAHRAIDDLSRAVQFRADFAARRARLAATRDRSPLATLVAIAAEERRQPRAPEGLFSAERLAAEEELRAALPELGDTAPAIPAGWDAAGLHTLLETLAEAAPAPRPVELKSWRISWDHDPTIAKVVLLEGELERRDGGARSLARAKAACASVEASPATALGRAGRIAAPDEELRRCIGAAKRRLGALVPPSILGTDAACRRLGGLLAIEALPPSRALRCAAKLTRGAEVERGTREEPILEEYVTVEENPAWAAFQPKARRWREELENLATIGVVASRVDPSTEAARGLTGGYDCDASGMRCTPRTQGGGESGSSAWSRRAWGEAMEKNQRRADELARLLAAEPPWKVEIKRTRERGRRTVAYTKTRLRVEGTLELEGRAPLPIAWRGERSGSHAATDELEAEVTAAGVQKLAAELGAESEAALGPATSEEEASWRRRLLVPKK